MPKRCMQAVVGDSHGIETSSILNTNDETSELKAKVFSLESRLASLTSPPLTPDLKNCTSESISQSYLKKDTITENHGDSLNKSQYSSSILSTPSNIDNAITSHEKSTLVIPKSRPLTSLSRVSKLNSHLNSDTSHPLMSELESYRSKHSELEERLAISEKEAQTAKFEKIQALQALEELEEENAKLQDEISELLNLVEKQHLQISSLESKAGRLERELSGYEGEEAILRQALEEADETVEELYERLQSTEEEVSNLRLSVSSSIGGLDSISMDENTEALNLSNMYSAVNAETSSNLNLHVGNEQLQPTVEAEVDKKESDKEEGILSPSEQSRASIIHHRRSSLSSVRNIAHDLEREEKASPFQTRTVQSSRTNSSSLLSKRSEGQIKSNQELTVHQTPLISKTMNQKQSQKTALLNSHGSSSNPLPFSPSRETHSHKRSAVQEITNQSIDSTDHSSQTQPWPSDQSPTENETAIESSYFDQQQMLLQKQQELLLLLLEKEREKKEKRNDLNYSWVVWGSAAIIVIATVLYTFTH